MTIKELIAIVNQHYPDDCIQNAFEEVDEQCGDTLALFIVREVKETFDPAAADYAQLEEAQRVIDKAQEELMFLVTGLDDELAKIARNKTP